MKKQYFFISIATLLIFTQNAFGACEIDNALSPELSKYKTKIAQVFSELQSKNTASCGPNTNGWIWSANRALELIDIARIQTPIYNDISTDFQYKTVMITRGESRSAVEKNGELFWIIQKNIINRAIESLANTCALTPELESTIVGYIRLNSALENIYKNAAIGKIIPSDGIPDIYSRVYNEIIWKYNPDATKTCKNEFDFAETMEKTLESFSNGTFGISNAWEDWQQAIALFSWKSTKGKYNDAKKKLLKQELAREGKSQSASDIIVANMDCVAKEQNDGGFEEELKAIAKCKQSPLSGLQKVKRAFDDTIKESPTTDIYIKKVSKSEWLMMDLVDASSLYSDLIGRTSNDIKTNAKIQSDLINMHITLLRINELLEKRIPIMQWNCMKALPDIEGGCRK